MAILTLDKLGFKAKKITQGEKRHYILIKG